MREKSHVNVKCEHCKATFSIKGNFKPHILSVHEEKKPFDYSDTIFGGEKTLKTQFMSEISLSNSFITLFHTYYIVQVILEKNGYNFLF